MPLKRHRNIHRLKKLHRKFFEFSNTVKKKLIKLQTRTTYQIAQDIIKTVSKHNNFPEHMLTKPNQCNEHLVLDNFIENLIIYYLSEYS